MADRNAEPFVRLDRRAISRLMPMHVHIGHTGHIRAVGPTIARLLPEDDLIGRRFLEVFALRRPRAVRSMDELHALVGHRLHLQLRKPPGTALRGLAVDTPDVGGLSGLIVNLSFGISVNTAVKAHGLTDTDFAATDLTIEMLYLTEAKTAVLGELRKLADRLNDAKSVAEEQALSDTLTGLRNRRALARALEGALEAGGPFGLVQIDLDYFKQVNDTLGHAAGDHVLCVVADILRAETRISDTIARVGGDEFVILFPGLANIGLLRRTAGRILARIEQPIGFDGQPCGVSASIGITTSEQKPRRSAEALMHDVDQALYISKNAGRGRVTLFAVGR